MAIGLTHLVSSDTGEDGGRLLSLLLEHLPRPGVRQSVVFLSRPPASIQWPADIEIPARQIGQRWSWPPAAGLDFRRELERGAGPMLLAWGPDAAATAYTATRGQGRFAVVNQDPAQSERTSRWWRSIQAHGQAVPMVCSSGHVQRRLVEHGVAPDSTTVIRPGVGYAALGQARQQRREANRRELFLPDAPATASTSDLTVLLTLSPPSRTGGQYFVAWAAALLCQVRPDLRVIIPGRSREQERIRRLVDEIYCPQIFRFTEDEYSWSELLGMSDMLVIPAGGDISTDAIPWAMAAGVPIVAAAVHCLTEFLADRQNALLCKSHEPYPMAIRLQEALNSPALMQECARTARTQAFNVFRTQRCVDEFLKLIRNLSENRPVFENIQDAARAG